MFYLCRSNKIFKICIFVLITFICVTSVLNIVIASDINHKLNCHDDNCTHCQIIDFCQIQIKVTINMMLIIAIMSILKCNYRIAKLINKINKTYTLIDCKIQLNN